MFSPHYHDGPCTVEASGKIVMHDTLEDAFEHAAALTDCHVYEGTFTPLSDVLLAMLATLT